MRLNQLNVSTVRGRDQELGSDSNLEVSRRDALVLAGAATVGAEPALRALDSALRGSATMVAGRGRVSFVLRGQARWTIDVRRFAGNPRLSVRQHDRLIRVELSGARYPGTNIPADLVAEITPGVSGSRLHLRMTLGGFECTVHFERWLLGTASARSRVVLSERVAALDAEHLVALVGPARCEYAPDWVLTLSGRGIGRLHGFGSGLKSDEVALSLVQPHQVGIAARVHPKRTSLVFGRGERSWSLDALVATHIGASRRSTISGDLTADGSPFDTLHLEAAQTAQGRTSYALLATGAGEIRFQPDGHLLGSDGQPFHFQLHAPRYARAFGKGSGETALVAQFHPESRWLRAGGCVLEVGHQDGTAIFEALGQNGRMHLTCAPALLSLAAPLEGVIVEPVPVAAGTRLELSAGTRRPGRPAGTARLHIHPRRHGFFELQTSNLVVSLLRPTDLLNIKVELVNFSLQTGGSQPAQLVRNDANPAYLIVHFPAQHIAEQAFLEGYQTPLQPGYVDSRISGGSRLAFSIPTTITTIPYTLLALLDWHKYRQNVTDTALPPGQTTFSTITQPAPTETDIEAPWRLHMSPDTFAGWSHSSSEVTMNGRTELWHTRLGVNSGGILIEGPTTMRAVWSPDYLPGNTAPSGSGPSSANPFTNSLDANDRDAIVRLTSDYQQNGYIPLPVAVERMMLTSLGAWLNSQGSWDYADSTFPFSLVAWRHTMTMGRDQYVKVVHKGYLMPFRHPAAVITITERKFLRDPSGAPRTIAYLMQRSYIVVRQPLRTFESADYPPAGGPWTGNHMGRDMPFKSVLLTTTVTPNIVDPPNEAIGSYGAAAFWPRDAVSNADIVFHCIATDWLGQQSEFTMPMLFVDSTIASNTRMSSVDGTQTALQHDVIPAYNADGRGNGYLSSQSVALAPMSPAPLPGKPAPDPSLHTESMKFQTAWVPLSQGLAGNQPYFFPILGSASVHIPAVKQLSGQDTPQDVALHSAFVQYGLNDTVNNKGQVFAEVLSAIPLSFSKPAPSGAAITPGVATPDMSIKGLSASLGSFSGTAAAAATIAAGTFNPGDAFAGLTNAKILGAIPISDIIDITADLSKAPQLVTNQLPDAIDTAYTWSTPVKDAVSFFKARYENPPGQAPGANALLSLTATVHQPVPKGGALQPPQFSIVGSLSDFTLDFTLIALPFHFVKFTIEDGKKLSVDANVGSVFFGGFLSFVNALTQFFGSFEDPPYLDVEIDKVEAGYTLTIPDIGVGVFSLQNISLGAKLVIPFFGDPLRVAFYFATREHPFIVTVYIFGGGGFFQIGLGPKGVETIEASIEFGANIALSLVVASGSVSVMAGIYMKWDISSGSGALTGFVDIHGSLEVLGLITVDVEFYLGLTYDFGTKKVSGEAFLKVEIDICFFSKTVTLGPIRKEFGGSNSSAATAGLFTDQQTTRPGTPRLTIKSMMNSTDWATYCDAFAP